MLWKYFNPVLTHFYWIKGFMSLEYIRREIWENQGKNTAKFSYIWYLNCLMFWPNQLNLCLCSIRYLNEMLKKIIFLLISLILLIFLPIKYRFSLLSTLLLVHFRPRKSQIGRRRPAWAIAFWIQDPLNYILA